MKYLNQIVPRLTRSLGRQSKTEPVVADQEFSVKPVYELNETPESWGLTAHMPGVTKENLEITVEDSLVTVRGKRSWQKPEAWTAVYRESLDAPYELILEHDNVVDADKIHAEFKDGVLRVSLPKADAVKPRKIVIN